MALVEFGLSVGCGELRQFGTAERKPTAELYIISGKELKMAEHDAPQEPPDKALETVKTDLQDTQKRRKDAKTGLRIGEVFKLSWMLLTKNIVFWLVLALAVHFVSWSFSWALWGYVEYAYKGFLDGATGKLIENLSIPEPLNAVLNATFFKELAILFVHLTLLQVVSSQLVYDTLLSGKQRISPYKALEQWGSTANKIDILFDALRTVGITLVYYAVLFAYFFILLAVWAPFFFFAGSISSVAGCVFFVILGLGFTIAASLGFLFCAGRWFVIVPVTVIQNAKVLESFKFSWRLTASFPMKMIGILVLTLLIFIFLSVFLLVLLPVLAGVIAHLGDTEVLTEILMKFISVISAHYNVIGTLVLTIVVSVCYYCLRSIQDQDDTASVSVEPA